MTGGEGLALGGHDNHTAIHRHCLKRLDQILEHVQTEGVALFGTGQRDRRHPLIYVKPNPIEIHDQESSWRPAWLRWGDVSLTKSHRY